jgi:hypothetical protein
MLLGAQAMRDGIYKNLPLPKPWKAFLKSCTLDAERGEIAREKCERAVFLELRDVPPKFREAFREKIKATESLLPGFKVFGSEVTSSETGGENSPLTNRVLAHARRLESRGLKGQELEGTAYAVALEDGLAAAQRLIEQTILTSGSDSESKATLTAVREAIKSVKTAPIVDAFLAGGSLNLPPARRPIDLDEDLSRVNL